MDSIEEGAVSKRIAKLTRTGAGMISMGRTERSCVDHRYCEGLCDVQNKVSQWNSPYLSFIMGLGHS